MSVRVALRSVSVAAPQGACGGEGGMGGAGGGWPRDAPALLSTALLLGGALPERPPAPLFTIDSILAPRPHPPIPQLQLQHLAHSPFHRAHDLFGTFANSLGNHIYHIFMFNVGT